MRTITRISAALLATASAAGAFASAGDASTRGSTALTYTVRNAGIAYLTKSGLSTSFPGVLQTGDEIFSRDFLFQGSTKIGYDNEACTVTFDDDDLCHTISVFAGKGDVEATWLWIARNSSEYGPSHFSGIIDGGTGTFARARGQFDATSLPNGTVRITVRLRSS